MEVIPEKINLKTASSFNCQVSGSNPEDMPQDMISVSRTQYYQPFLADTLSAKTVLCCDPNCGFQKMKPLPLVCSASLWECDPLLINLFLTMSGSGPDPQAHALFLFLFYHFFQSLTLAREGSLPFLFSSLMLPFNTRASHSTTRDACI